jgi:Icc-related predicted phosphoesterase
VTAVDQAQTVEFAGEAFAPLPAPPGPAPYRLALSKVLPGLAGGTRTFQVIGDSGGVKDPNPQAHVAAAQVADLTNGVEFVYHVGDVDYFTGEQGEAVPQFFEPYAHVNVPVFAIPGNHDGAGQDQLATFMRYFCDQQGPRLLPEIAEYHRDTMDQPNCYWTLTDELVTMIGLYSNVPSGGEIQEPQIAWLVEELKAAPMGVPLIVALHHPPYSGDAHHGGSERMGKLLDTAFMSAGRWPSLVLAGHVHNYQRFTRTLHAGHDCTYVVCGASGYHNLHGMASGAAPGLQVTPDTVLEAFEDKQYGFLRLAVTKTSIAGEYVAVDKEGLVTRYADKFTVALS